MAIVQKSASRLKSILLILNTKTLIVTALAVCSTHLCIVEDFTADIPLTVIATAIIFPIVFSIGGAYKRRETALDHYGSIKAHLRSLYLATRDWTPEKSDSLESECLIHVEFFFKECQALLISNPEEMTEHEENIYRSFSEISLLLRKLSKRGLAPSEISRVNQYLSKTVYAFERLKHIYQYRTPKTLRAFSDLFIVIVPVLYGPYFAYLSAGFSPGLEYIMPVLFSFIFVSLDNIQEHLENPFDKVGEDDIHINGEKFIKYLKG